MFLRCLPVCFCASALHEAAFPKGEEKTRKPTFFRLPEEARLLAPHAGDWAGVAFEQGTFAVIRALNNCQAAVVSLPGDSFLMNNTVPPPLPPPLLRLFWTVFAPSTAAWWEQWVAPLPSPVRGVHRTAFARSGPVRSVCHFSVVRSGPFGPILDRFWTDFGT